MKSVKKIKIILADDHTIFREGLRALLENEHDIEIIGETSNGANAVELAREKKPDVIVMDITMPELNGLLATSKIKSFRPETGVVILTMSEDEELVEQAIQAGVNGYLVKETASSDLLAAIREVNKGNAFFSPSVSKVLLAKKQNILTPGSVPQLTFREKEVLQLIAGSKTNKEIGVLLNISPKTVDGHRQQIMEKLDIHDIAGLTRYAIQKGFLK